MDWAILRYLEQNWASVLSEVERNALAAGLAIRLEHCLPIEIELGTYDGAQKEDDDPYPSEVLTAWKRWVSGVVVNGVPFDANHREYGIAMGAFYAAWHRTPATLPAKPDVAVPDATDIAEHLDDCDGCLECAERAWCEECGHDTIPVRGDCHNCNQPVGRTTAPDRIQEH